MNRPARPLAVALVLALLPAALLAADLSKKISLDFRDTDLREIFKLVAEKAGLGLVAEKSVRGNVTLRLLDVPVIKALDTLAMTNGYAWALVNDSVIVCDEKKLPTRSVVHPVANIGVQEATKALLVTLKKDLRACSVGDDSIILTGREDVLREAEHLLAAIDKPRRRFQGSLQIFQGGKVLQALEFQGFSGKEVHVFEGTSMPYPKGADQPPQIAEVGLTMDFQPVVRTGAEFLEGTISVHNCWIEKFEGAVPVTGNQRLQSDLRALPGKPVKLGKFSQDREVVFTFTWEG